MGFFKNLKKRLFTLNIDEKPSSKKKRDGDTVQVDLDKLNLSAPKKSKSDFSATKSHDDFMISSSNALMRKKEEKRRRKQLAKEKKINKYVAGMKKTGSSFSIQLKELQSKHTKIDDEYFDELEEVLIMADISVALVLDIIDEIKKEVRLEQIDDVKLINEIIADKLFTIYANQSNITTELDIQEDRLNVILVIGVNGSGKTTSIAKLANNFVKQNKKVLLAAADTFRAGAVAQLDVWAKRINCDIVKSKKPNGDPSAVVFDAVNLAKNEKYDVLIIDTAGRLQNKVNLMKELEKMNKVIQRSIPDAPHETLLILDSTTGQNGVNQAMQFKSITNLTGIILTKMDGTSKGGIVFTIKDKTNIPVKFLGLGEKIDDLLEFDLDNFIYGLTKDWMNA